MVQNPAKELHVGIGAVVHKDAVLVIRRDAPAVPEYDKKWELPGGKLEPGETVVDAIIRELREETGFDVKFAEMLPFDYTADLMLTDPPLHVRVECGLCELSPHSNVNSFEPLPVDTGSHDYSWWKLDSLPYEEVMPGTNEFLAWISYHLGYKLRPGAGLYHARLENETHRYYSILLEFRPEKVFERPFVLTIKYGSSHGRPTTKTLSHPTMEQALKDARRRLARHKLKGYYLVDIDDNNPLRSWLQYVGMPTTDRACPVLFKDRDLRSSDSLKPAAPS